METHYRNLWVKSPSYVTDPLDPTRNIEAFRVIRNWDKLDPRRRVEKVDSKQFYFNTGPTAYSNAESYVIYAFGKVVGIYLTRFRNDGFGTIDFKWDGTYEEWKSYSTMQESRDFLKVMDRWNEM